MCSNPLDRYSHTQRTPWCWLLYAIGSGMAVGAFLAIETTIVAISLACSALLMLTLGMSFQYLQVTGDERELNVRFGPLPLFQFAVPYDRIRSATVGRTSWIDGWGIHWSVKGGWVWNTWGFDCVVVEHDAKKVFIGTDDAESLAAFFFESEDCERIMRGLSPTNSSRNNPNKSR